MPALRRIGGGRQAVLRSLRSGAAMAMRGVRFGQSAGQPVLRRLRCRRTNRRGAGVATGGTPPAHRHVLRHGRLDALASRLDPEDLREIIGAYHRCVAETSPGSAASSPDTWATACWCISAIPGARERRRTGGARRPRCRRCRQPAHSSPSHCGFASASPPDMVVVGDLIGAGEGAGAGVVGETPNLAARLQALAEPEAS